MTSVVIGYFSDEKRTKRVAKLLEENSGFRNYRTAVSNEAGNISLMVSTDCEGETEESVMADVAWLLVGELGKQLEG